MIETNGQKHELRYDGGIDYKQTDLTDPDKRARLTSRRIGDTTRTKEERQALGMDLSSIICVV
jgi:hypothetical protein